MPEEVKPFSVLYDYSDAPTVKEFTEDNTRIRCIMGPFGCVAGNSLIVTEKGLVPISDINQPTRVLTWNARRSRFEVSLSGGAFPKGMDYLYRISTPQGVFVAAGRHRVLCADNKYRYVESLRPGCSLSLCSDDQRQRFLECDLLSLPVNDLCFDQKVEGLMGRYAMSARRYGQRLLWEEYISPLSSPILIDVQILQNHSDEDEAGRKDDQGEMSPIRIHQDQFGVLRQTDDYLLRDGLRPKGGQGQISLPLFLRIEAITLRSLQSLWKFVSRHTKKLSSACSRSYSSSSLSDGSIVSIERLSVKNSFWDMQVLGTNNYVTSDGTIHHNSGKTSGCIMDIFRRAVEEQTPSPDGIRRSRWAVVRNTYAQLKDTTIRSFHEWFPPKIFGEYHVTDHNYYITNIPGVHLELCYRALDREDQVSNLLSFEFTSAYFNEAREIPWGIIDAMDGRIGRYPRKDDIGEFWHGIIMDTNPPDEDSKLYKMAEVIRPDNFKMFKQPSGLSLHAENTKHLQKNYYQNLAKGKDEMFVRLYCRGEYGYLVSGKPVFQSFRDNVHVSPRELEPEKGVDVLIGVDFGLQPAVTIGQLTALGQLRVLDELVSDGMGIRQFCLNQLLPLLRKKYFGMNVMGYGDPSGVSRSPTDESTCFEVLHSQEIGLSSIIEAPTNAIMPRVGAVETYLNKMTAGEPGFILSPNCRALRKAMNGGYHYDKDPKGSGDEYKPMPLKNFASHIADSLEYLCMYLTEKEAYDKQRKSFLASIKHKAYNPASEIAGY